MSVEYNIPKEIIGEPSLKLDGEIKVDKKLQNVADILSNITNIPVTKLNFFIEKFGLKCILYNPSIIGVTDEQKNMLKQVCELLDLLGGDYVGPINNAKSVRY